MKKCPNSGMNFDKSDSDKHEGNTKTDLHKSDKRHKLDKCQPFPKGPRYERYTPLMANHTTILGEEFNLEVPIQLP